MMINNEDRKKGDRDGDKVEGDAVLCVSLESAPLYIA